MSAMETLHFDVDRFRRLVARGMHPDKAAQELGYAPRTVWTLLRRRGWRIEKIVTYVCVPIEPAG